jgi:hypothetical protein
MRCIYSPRQISLLAVIAGPFKANENHLIVCDTRNVKTYKEFALTINPQRSPIAAPLSLRFLRHRKPIVGESLRFFSNSLAVGYEIPTASVYCRKMSIKSCVGFHLANEKRKVRNGKRLSYNLFNPKGSLMMKRAVIASAVLALMTSIASAQQVQDVQPQARGIPSRYDPSFSKATQTRGIDMPPGQLAANLPDLKQQALMGNASAAATIAAGMSMCHSAMQRSNVNDSFNQDHCLGLAESDLKERGKWLSIAASLGNVEAQYGYAVGGPADIVGTQVNGSAPVTLNTYKDTARKYLTALAQKCNIDGIYVIAFDGRRNGLLYGDDPVTSYKFLQVYKTIVGKPSSNAFDADEKQLESKIASSSALSNAQQDASSFVANYCK